MSTEQQYRVFCNVYDVTNTGSDTTSSMIVKLNNVTRELGLGGIFHGAVAIDDFEWSFGYCDKGSGVYCCHAKQNPMYVFREAVDLGPTPRSKQEIKDILQRLKHEWPGDSYDLLARNCCHFCEAFCRELQIKPPPAWLNRFATSADATVALTNDAVTMARNVSSHVSRSAAQSVSWLRDTFSRMVIQPEFAHPTQAADGNNSRVTSSSGASTSGGTSSTPAQAIGNGAAALVSRLSQWRPGAGQRDSRDGTSRPFGSSNNSNASSSSNLQGAEHTVAGRSNSNSSRNAVDGTHSEHAAQGSRWVSHVEPVPQFARIGRLPSEPPGSSNMPTSELDLLTGDDYERQECSDLSCIPSPAGPHSAATSIGGRVNDPFAEGQSPHMAFKQAQMAFTGTTKTEVERSRLFGSVAHRVRKGDEAAPEEQESTS